MSLQNDYWVETLEMSNDDNHHKIMVINGMRKYSKAECDSLLLTIPFSLLTDKSLPNTRSNLSYRQLQFELQLVLRTKIGFVTPVLILGYSKLPM
jgi:hypothetical protein